MKTVKLTLILVITGFAIAAQGQTEETWTFKQCLERAMSKNLDLKLNQISIQRSEQALVDARHALYPDFNMSASHSYNTGRSFDVFTNAPVTERVRFNSFSASSNITVFNGNRNRLNIKASQIGIEISQKDYEVLVNNTALSMANAYLQILLNKEALENTDRQLLNTKEQIERVAVQVKYGLLPELDLKNLESQQASNQQLIIEAENNLNLSILTLKQLLQMQDGEDLSVADIDELNIDLSSLNKGINELFETALQNQPSIERADLGIESSDVSVKMAKGQYLPTLTAAASLSTTYSSAQKDILVGREGTTQIPIGFFTDPSGVQIPVFTTIPDPSSAPIVSTFGFADQLEESMNQRISLFLNIPIYNRNTAKSAVNRAMLDREQAVILKDQAKNQLRQDIEQSYYQAKAAQKALDASMAQVKALEETHKVVTNRFEQNLITSNEFNISLNNLNSAQSDLLRSKYTLIFRLKVLDFYSGIPIDLK